MFADCVIGPGVTIGDGAAIGAGSVVLDEVEPHCLYAGAPRKIRELRIIDAGPGGKAERFVPRGYWLASAMRTLAPRLTRRVVAGSGTTMTPTTGADLQARS